MLQKLRRSRRAGGELHRLLGEAGSGLVNAVRADHGQIPDAGAGPRQGSVADCVGAASSLVHETRLLPRISAGQNQPLFAILFQSIQRGTERGQVRSGRPVNH